MAVGFDSFDQSPLGDAFIQSALGDARGLESTLVFAGSIIYSDSSETVNDVGKFNVGTNKLELFGLNEGFNGSVPVVTNVLEYKKELYVCGSMFENNDATRSYKSIARYDNEDGIWKILSGTDLATASNDLCIFGDNLVVCGTFSDANGVTDTVAIAAWDGTDYLSLDSDGSSFVLSSFVHRCFAFKGLLYASGNFFVSPGGGANSRKIKKYDGATWEELVPSTSDPFSNRPNAMIVFQGSLFLAGTGYVFSWDGTAFTEITIDVKRGIFDGIALRFTIYKGDLIMCGNFDSVEGVTTKGVARYDGNTWSALGNGIETSISLEVSAVHVDSGILYASGDFVQNGDGDTVKGIATWNPGLDKWENTGIRDDVTGNTNNVSLTSFSGKLDFEPGP